MGATFTFVDVSAEKGATVRMASLFGGRPIEQGVTKAATKRSCEVWHPFHLKCDTWHLCVGGTLAHLPVASTISKVPRSRMSSDEAPT
jgi:hypothetical protein